MAVASAGPYANLHLAPDSNPTSTQPLVLNTSPILVASGKDDYVIMDSSILMEVHYLLSHCRKL